MSNTPHYVVHGITEHLKPGDDIPVRREVDEWYHSEDGIDQLQVFLFLMALAEFQAMPPEDEQGNPNTLSYFQVAGIHGYPKIPWDEDTVSQAPDNSWGGYCTHRSILFPTWHRPYMLLFERLVFEHMLSYIDKSPVFDGPTKDLLRKAATTWRLPYWDQSKEGKDKTYKFPDIAVDEFIPVPPGLYLERPEDFKNMPNPMYKYRLPAGTKFSDFKVEFTDKDDDGNLMDYGICEATGRCPREITGPEWVGGANNYKSITEAMENHHWYQWPDEPKENTITLAESVYRLLTKGYFTQYESFASTRQYKTSDTPLNWLSIEAIHNNLHLWIGGNGQMSQIAVSAFDPIFFLHHCNFDRLFALWQNINGDHEDYWVKQSYPDQRWSDQEGNWSTKPNSRVDATTPLAPFRTGPGENDYWTSDDTKNWYKLGYTYPGLPQKWVANIAEGLPLQLHSSFQLEVVKAVNESDGIARLEFLQFAEELEKTPESDGSYLFPDYVANIQYDKFALDGRSYIIHLILGDAEKAQDTRKIQMGKNAVVVDIVYNFAGVDVSACANCRQQREEGQLCTAQVPLNRALLALIKDKSSELKTFDADVVENFLNENLKWFITTTSGIVLDTEGFVPRFEVHVAVGEVKYLKDPKKYSGFHNYSRVAGATSSLMGGWSAQE